MTSVEWLYDNNLDIFYIFQDSLQRQELMFHALSEHVILKPCAITEDESSLAGSLFVQRILSVLTEFVP